MSTAAQWEIGVLLEQAGAHPHGNRHDCPKCSGVRTITHTDECFFCHKCQWKGNSVTLAKELGIYRRLPSAEYQVLRQERERADHAARTLYQAVKAQRMELFGSLHGLNRLELAAHNAGPTEAAWDGLAIVYGRRPGVLATLAILENASAADLFEFLNADGGTREKLVTSVIQSGGMYDRKGKFIEV